MALGSGLSAQFGMADNTGTYGAYETPTRFLPFDSEGIQANRERIEVEGGLGMSTTGMRRHDRQAGSRDAKGPVNFTVYNKGFGMIFKHIFGTADGTAHISTPGGGTATRDHTFTPTNAYGQHFTWQIGKPTTDGTVRPFTYLGGKVTDWTLKNSTKGFLLLEVNADFQDEDTTATLASASYPSAITPLSFVGGAFTIAGSAYTVKDITIKGTTGVDTDDFNIGSALKDEPIQSEYQTIDIEVQSDYDGTAQYANFTSDTTAALVASWQGPLIEGSLYYKLTLTIPVAMFDGDTPTVEGPGKLSQPLKWKALYNGTDAFCTCVYRTTDTAA